jgi:3-phenylpropionate/trans-cinnamate dioxygenase ferredoxin reductase subunit
MSASEPTPKSILIVGAGQAGFWAARTLRTQGYDGRLVLVGNEPHPPYERPPLSKQVLKGDAEPRSAWLATPEQLAELKIEFLAETTAAAIDRDGHRAELSDGTRIGYDRLLLTTGARPRRLQLPGEGDAPVFYLRDIADSLALRAQLAPGKRVLVVGGGLIGLEAAAAAVARGAAVTVIEAAARLMARVVGADISAYIEGLHRRHRTAILTAAWPERIERAGDACRLICRDGRACDGDIIVIGVGIVPNADLAAAAGLKVDNGLLVDAFCRTEDPHIWAAGDVTNHVNPLLGRRLRLETWQNAQNQAIAAARNLLGAAQPYAEIPWGWSDQFDMNLQLLGAPTSFEHAAIRGDPESGSFSVFYLEGDRLAGVNAVNAPKDIAVARRLMAAEAPVDAQKLVDPSVPLRSLLR